MRSYLFSVISFTSGKNAEYCSCSSNSSSNNTLKLSTQWDSQQHHERKLIQYSITTAYTMNTKVIMECKIYNIQYSIEQKNAYTVHTLL